MKKIAVVAGNLREFDQFVLETASTAKSWSRPSRLTFVCEGKVYRYANSAEDLRGRIIDDAVHYGTWFNRKDISEVEDEIRLRMFK